MKIDPGYCPVCGNPICDNIHFVCSKECIYSTYNGRGEGCLQPITNYVSCKCELIDIMRAFDIPHRPAEPGGLITLETSCLGRVTYLLARDEGLDLSGDAFTLHLSSYQFEQQIKQFLQNRSYLPNDLFEI